MTLATLALLGWTVLENFLPRRPLLDLLPLKRQLSMLSFVDLWFSSLLGRFASLANVTPLPG